MSRKEVFTEIENEMNYADKWGKVFDDKNTPNDWIAYITKYAGQAVTLPWNADTFRAQLIKTAGLCISAVEALDRNNNELAKRHYD